MNADKLIDMLRKVSLPDSAYVRRVVDMMFKLADSDEPFELNSIDTMEAFLEETGMSKAALDKTLEIGAAIVIPIGFGASIHVGPNFFEALASDCINDGQLSGMPIDIADSIGKSICAIASQMIMTVTDTWNFGDHEDQIRSMIAMKVIMGMTKEYGLTNEAVKYMDELDKAFSKRAKEKEESNWAGSPDQDAVQNEG